MSVDLIVHAGTKFALHQWLDARDLGNNVQDTDPNSPTFGQYRYTHTVGNFHYWNHPSGKLERINPAGVFFNGFYARLSFTDEQFAGPETENLQTWVRTRTAVSVLESFNGVGGEGITIVNPEDIYKYLADNSLTAWGGLLGVPNLWSDPRLWAYSNVMTGDIREFDGVQWRSLIDFNVWTPTQLPTGWERVTQ